MEKYKNRIFIHIPRTGGFTFMKIYCVVKALHCKGNMLVDYDTNLYVTQIRDQVMRYLSEWYFYGLNFFSHDKTVKGWKPQGGYHKSIIDFMADKSTHNAICKILLGYDLYSEKIITDEDIDFIVYQIKKKIYR